MADAIGLVKKNANPARTGAEYSLVDKNGVPRYFLRPPEDLDLSQFINKPVRVRGQSSSLPNGAGRRLDIEEVLPPTGGDVAAAGPARRRDARPNGVRQVGYEQEGPEPVRGRMEPASRAREPLPNDPNARTDAAFGEPVDSPYDPVDGDGDFFHTDPACDSCGSCGSGGCCWPPGMFWVRTEYLYWWTEGMRIPPLVTTGPSVSQPGFLGSPGTVILFGNSLVNNTGISGGRITAGMWLNSCNTMGIEGDYFALGTQNTNFYQFSGGNPILSRPFFDTRPTLNDENVELVAAPGQVTGSVGVQTSTRFQGAGVRLLFNWCCWQSCYGDPCCIGMGGPGGGRLDLFVGYRFLRLDDNVAIREDLTSINPQIPGSFVVKDSFNTQNQFHGVDFGMLLQGYRGRWSGSVMSKIALGNTHEIVNIAGSTDTTQNGVTTTSVGGLLAQSTNIGNYSRDEFAVVPELATNIGYNITPRLRAIFGYTFIYWSRVARAGDQIDTDVNSTLLANSPTPPAGDLRHPKFAFNSTDFWAQGINVGLDYRW